MYRGVIKMTITGEYITDYLEICENIKEYRKENLMKHLINLKKFLMKT